MGTEQDKTAPPKSEDPPAAGEREQGVLAHDDLLSADALDLSATGEPTAGNMPAPLPEEAVLRLEELLIRASGDDNDSQALAGGIITFDSESSPGNTIVRLTLEGSEAHNACEVATLPGVFTDLNSLLGLLGEGGYHHT